jgi:uncharacterized protein YuzE
MKINHDPEVDVLQVIFSEAPVEKSDETKPGIVLDYDKDGNIVGLEVLDARAFFDARNGASRLTIQMNWRDENREYIVPPQNVAGEITTLDELVQVIQRVAEEWGSDVTCRREDDDSGGVCLALTGQHGGVAKLHWW